MVSVVGQQEYATTFNIKVIRQYIIAEQIYTRTILGRVLRIGILCRLEVELNYQFFLHFSGIRQQFLNDFTDVRSWSSNIMNFDLCDWCV